MPGSTVRKTAMTYSDGGRRAVTGYYLLSGRWLPRGYPAGSVTEDDLQARVARFVFGTMIAPSQSPSLDYPDLLTPSQSLHLVLYNRTKTHRTSLHEEAVLTSTTPGFRSHEHKTPTTTTGRGFLFYFSPSKSYQPYGAPYSYTPEYGSSTNTSRPLLDVFD
ncbi:hypothetical protein POSPLADRAFT_1058082 [Postia placenta MAD-698-R-SB12]|uniref:Uncharacterized protein n=1 Tax=Postia placenta MAD-698-R-SB12 TaxID=670580 RepID=A0A1X6MY37_9APHY|nr:hypothetical protein POSPLADRAFT_1058082 [Postia placenta MAD-698-R-SB12]OSX61150.1 hypothetical protein POSPLADRAFT_1058082 [Postia placenta MAD-698-R-SB12]